MSTLHASQDLINLIKQTILDTSYPIGNIIVTMNNKNPSTYLGGTWSKIGSGRTLFSAFSDSQLGNTIDSGLPNLTGILDPRWVDETGGGVMMYIQNNGVFYTSKEGPIFWANTDIKDAQGSYHNRIHFDASNCNSIYGRSSIVQPPAVYVYFWRRTA